MGLGHLQLLPCVRKLAVMFGRSILFGTVVLLAGCESSQADSCPFPASDCPTACMAIDGMQVDAVRRCRFKTRLGCEAPGAQTEGCFFNVDDGRIVAVGSAMQALPGWRRCDAAEGDRLRAAAPVCAPPNDGGASADASTK